MLKRVRVYLAAIIAALGSVQAAPAADTAAAVKLAREYLQCHDAKSRRSIERQLAQYDGGYQRVLDALAAQKHSRVRGGYYPEEHFSVGELRKAHPDDLLYFNVPKTYRRDRPTGLIIFLHGGGNRTSRYAPRSTLRTPKKGESSNVALGDLFEATGMIAVGPSAPWDTSTTRRWCVHSADQYLADVIRECKSRFNIDADRVFLLGHSMGGFGAYHHIQRQPDRFAAVIAHSGSWTLGYWPVIRGTPLCIIQGVRDARPGGRPHWTDIEYARWTDKILAGENLEHTYMERPGGHALAGGRPQIAAFFASARNLRRDPYYPHVTVATPVGFREGYYCTRATHNRWLSLDETSRGKLRYDSLCPHGGSTNFTSWRLEHTTVERSGAAVEAVNHGDNHITVTTHNAARFTIWLHPKMVDLAKPVTIDVDGRTIFRGTVHASLATALQSFQRRGDWGLIYPVKVEIAKGRSGKFRASTDGAKGR